MEKEIVINQNLDANQIAKVNILVLYSSKLKYFMFLIGFAILFQLFNAIYNPSYLNNSSFNLKDLLPVLTLPFIYYIIWSSIKKSSKKVYETNNRLFKNVNYFFNTIEFKITGENFSNSYKWNELKKVKETKNWLLIYTNEYQATAIDKNQQKTETINEIKELLNSINIKKD